MPKLSIITVNLNNKAGLQKTIDSVITQTYKDFEWIIIDGGSTDGSKELIEKNSSYITYWVSEPDKGIYNAMNKGIKVANGEYLQFLNSGDFLHDKMALASVFLNKKQSSDIIVANIISNGKIYRGIGSTCVTLNSFFYGSVAHPATFSQSYLFAKYGFFDETYKIASDWKFFLKTMILGNVSISYIDKVLVNFDGTGISSTNHALARSEKDKIFQEILPPRVLEDYRFMKNEFLISSNSVSRFIYAVMLKLLQRLKLHEN